MNSFAYLVGSVLTAILPVQDNYNYNTGGIVNPDVPVASLFDNAASWLLGAVGGIAVIFVIIGGIQYAAALGDSDKMDKAKRTLKWSILGLILATLAYFIVPTVANMVQ